MKTRITIDSMCLLLASMGHTVSRRQVYRYMRRLGIRSAYRTIPAYYTPQDLKAIKRYLGL